MSVARTTSVLNFTKRNLISTLDKVPQGLFVSSSKNFILIFVCGGIADKRMGSGWRADIGTWT